jgi:putative membrane protein
MLRIMLAAIHLVALGLGLGAVLERGTAVRLPISADSLRRAFRADTRWGVAAVLWIGTGIWRLLAATEKSPGYYMTNRLFLAKMLLLVLILGLEVRPMITLIRWRAALAKGASPEAVADPGVARRIALVSHAQAVLVVLMIFAAVAMARGYGVMP